MTHSHFGQSIEFGGFCELGVGLVDMAGNSLDPW